LTCSDCVQQLSIISLQRKIAVISKIIETRGSGEPVINNDGQEFNQFREILCRLHTTDNNNLIVKTVIGHLFALVESNGWRSWSPDTILKVYYPRTIHAMFALNWLTGFRREDF
jgi:hypothetical protein